MVLKLSEIYIMWWAFFGPFMLDAVGVFIEIAALNRITP